MGRKKSQWKKPTTIAEQWENLTETLRGDQSSKVKRDRRGKKIKPKLTEQDKYDQYVYQQNVKKRENDEELKKKYDSGEITDYDVRREGLTIPGVTDIPTQNDLANETTPDTGGDEKDDTSSGVIEQPPTGDDGQQADIENKVVLKKDIDRKIAVAKNEEYLKSVSWDGMNRTYTTNYRDAVKNAAGWSKFYDDQDEAGNPIEKSDVFTRGEDGQPLGVMTRSQRRAYDMRMHEAKMNQQHQKNADEATGGSGVYGEKGKEITTEWTTDQEANEAGKVITGGESAKTNVAEKSQANIIKPPEREEIKLPGGS